MVLERLEESLDSRLVAGGGNGRRAITTSGTTSTCMLRNCEKKIPTRPSCDHIPRNISFTLESIH